MVAHYPHCHNIVRGSLNRHTSRYPLQGRTFCSPKMFSQSQFSTQHSPYKQKVTVSKLETRLLSDTYAASPSAPLLQLHNITSVKETVTAALLPSHHDSP